MLHSRAPCTERDRARAYELQKGVCPVCHGHFDYGEMEGDHIVPWSKGGKTVPENLQMLCRRCNALKSDGCDFKSLKK